MNCRNFQEQLFEYLDGTLSTRTRQDLEQHLASCHGCRDALAKHQQVARRLSDHLCQSVESLTLATAVRRRILAARPTRDAPPRSNLLAHLWRQLAWPLSIACLLGAGFLFSNYFSGGRQARPFIGPRHASGSMPVSIKVSRVETTYTFRKEGEFVTDALVCRTNVVYQTLWAEVPSKAVPKGSFNKLSL